MRRGDRPRHSALAVVDGNREVSEDYLVLLLFFDALITLHFFHCLRADRSIASLMRDLTMAHSD